MNPEESTDKTSDSVTAAATETAPSAQPAPPADGTVAAKETAAAAANGSPATQTVTEARVREELKSVVDPEIGIDMINLGLVYDVKVDGSNVQVIMTLTSPGCPVAGMFINAVHAAVVSIPGVSDCKVDLTFSPPWDPRTMASEEAKMMLGIYY